MIPTSCRNYSRRALLLFFPSLAAAGTGAKAGESPLPSKAYPFEALPARKNGENIMRPVLQGATHSGFPIELHETDLAPGNAPHPPHHHQHEEIFMIREGYVDVTISGTTLRIGPGSVVYVASNEEHGVRNPGLDMLNISYWLWANSEARIPPLDFCCPFTCILLSGVLQETYHYLRNLSSTAKERETQWRLLFL